MTIFWPKRAALTWRRTASMSNLVSLCRESLQRQGLTYVLSYAELHDIRSAQPKGLSCGELLQPESSSLSLRSCMPPSRH